MTIAEGIRKEFGKAHNDAIMGDKPFNTFEVATVLKNALNKYGFDLRMEIRKGQAFFTPTDKSGNDILYMNNDFAIILKQIDTDSHFQGEAIPCRKKGESLFGLLKNMTSDERKTIHEMLDAADSVDEKQKSRKDFNDLECSVNTFFYGIKSAYGLLDAVMEHCFDEYVEKDKATLSSLGGISALMYHALKDGQKALEIIDTL